MTWAYTLPLHDKGCAPPRGNVLLLSCMDLRLLDDTAGFMQHDNLANRYDHVILAGAALGALGGGKKSYRHWKKTFFNFGGQLSPGAVSIPRRPARVTNAWPGPG